MGRTAGEAAQDSGLHPCLKLGARIPEIGAAWLWKAGYLSHSRLEAEQMGSGLATRLGRKRLKLGGRALDEEVGGLGVGRPCLGSGSLRMWAWGSGAWVEELGPEYYRCLGVRLRQSWGWGSGMGKLEWRKLGVGGHSLQGPGVGGGCRALDSNQTSPWPAGPTPPCPPARPRLRKRPCFYPVPRGPAGCVPCSPGSSTAASSLPGPHPRNLSPLGKAPTPFPTFPGARLGSVVDAPACWGPGVTCWEEGLSRSPAGPGVCCAPCPPVRPRVQSLSSPGRVPAPSPSRPGPARPSPAQPSPAQPAGTSGVCPAALGGWLGRSVPHCPRERRPLTTASDISCEQ
ncbi:translation initiation factor IF-2-like [Antechinus flavipes]|uniref:translation initiation factor IF-2-like n=1 Tax=Antechinus flavipes TaxID=38775 RepID=UPI002235D105|nr:translation initiation factor IF-2-like [Antechinus flavipes]